MLCSASPNIIIFKPSKVKSDGIVMKPTLLKILYILALLIVAGGLLVFAAEQKSFSEDESFTATFAQRDPGELLQGVAWDVHPPLYLYLIGQWGRYFGFNELGLRSFSILCMLTALLLTYKLALDLLGEREALIAITLTAFMPLIIMFGHNARYYSLAVLLALLAAWSAVRFDKPRQALFPLLYVISAVAFLYLIFAAAVVLVACNLWWLTRWFWQRGKHRVASLLLWLVAQAIIVALYLPGVRIFQSVTKRFSELAQVGNLWIELIKRAGYYGFVSAVGETISPVNPLAWLGVLIVVGVAIYALVKNWRRLNFWLPVSFFIIIAIANLLITFNAAVSATWQNLTYRALYAYPFLMIWLAAGFAQLKIRWAVVSGVALLLVFMMGIFNYLSGRQYLRPVYSVPWKQIFQQIQQEGGKEALVVCGFGDSSCYYYAERYGYGENNLSNWNAKTAGNPTEIWYIQSNLGRVDGYGDLPAQQEAFLAEMALRYPDSSVYDYAPQDPSIRSLKARIFHQDDYEYRVNVRKFYR